MDVDWRQRHLGNGAILMASALGMLLTVVLSGALLLMAISLHCPHGRKQLGGSKVVAEASPISLVPIGSTMISGELF